MASLAEDGGARVGRSLTGADLRTLMLASLGGALEFYDFIVFGFFLPTITVVFFPADIPRWVAALQASGLFSAGYLARPLGGVVMAHFGDLIGRKRVFIFSVFLMALPTLLIGFIPSYAAIGYAAPLTLLLFRVMQGAAIGGEAPGAWVFVAEHVPINRRGLACGSLTAGLTFGIVLGSIMSLAIRSSCTAEQITDWAWRIPFIVGGLFGFMAMALRRFLKETPVFEALRRRAEISQKLPIGRILSDHWRAVVVCMLATWMLTAGIVVVVVLTPNILKELYELNRLDMDWANVAATVTLTIASVLNGIAIDRFGPRATMASGVILIIIAGYAFYIGAPAEHSLLLPLYAFAGLAVGATGTVAFTMVRAFPAAIRFTGVSFSYNAAYAIAGALTPLLINLPLVRQMPLLPAHYLALATLVGGGAIIFLARPVAD